MRVLVLDSSEQQRRRFTDDLRKNGYLVDSASDGEEGLRLALAGDYDAVITEMTLPGGDGLQFVRRLREKRGDVGIIILSAMCDVNRRIDGLESGADDYISKSVSLEELLARIAAVIRRT